MREYLDNAIKADQCAQYVDDIGIAANDLTQLCINIKQSSNALEKQASSSRWLNAILESSKSTSCDEQSPQKEFLHKPKKSNTFFRDSNFQNPKKSFKYILGFYRNYIPRLSEKLSPFIKLLKETSQFCIPNTVLDTLNELNQQLEKSCSLVLRQPIKNTQLILMTDARFTAAGYAIMIEDDPNQKLQSRRKTYAPIAFVSKTFNPTQMKISMYAKEFSAIYFAFSEFGHLMWGSVFPVIVFTDNRSVTRL